MRQLMVKICGISRLQDAQLCVDLGATHLGLIFVPTSSRVVNEADAIEITRSMKNRVRVVAVFQDQSTEVIRAMKNRLSADLVQLHGTESVDDVTALAPAIKAITPAETGAWNYGFESAAEMLIFDRSKSQSGPSNQQWLDNLQQQLKLREPACPFMVAGGIGPDSATTVIRMFRDFENFCGIDVASGVEASPGIKDPVKLRALFKALEKECGYAVGR